MVYRLTAELARSIIEDEDALATLRGHTLEEVLAAIEDIDAIADEEEAFQALMGAMYALRPQGWL